MTEPAGRALVTGAGHRLGAAMARALGADGFSVALHYHRSRAAAESVAAEAAAAGAPQAVLAQADLTREAETAPLVDQAAAALGGPLTLLINNAAVFERDEALDATRESWDRHLEANLRAPFVLSQRFAAQAPPPDARGEEPTARALIVNMLDQRVLNLTPHFVSYTVSKAGLWTLTQTLAMALGPQVRVNGVGPGTILASPGQSADHVARQRRGTPLQRGADPEDVVAALRYLILARSVTGQIIALDGGQHLNWRP